MFLKYSCQKPLKKNCGRPVFFEELQAARNFLKVFLHFNKTPKTSFADIFRNMHFFVCCKKKVLQKQSVKIDLKVPEKSCDEIDDDVMKFIS